MAYRLCLLLIGLVWTTWAQAGPKEEALAAYDQFFTLFTTGNQVQVAALFAPDALFYGTGSADVVTTPEGVTAYFAGALSGTRGQGAAVREYGATALGHGSRDLGKMAVRENARREDGYRGAIAGHRGNAKTW